MSGKSLKECASADVQPRIASLYQVFLCKFFAWPNCISEVDQAALLWNTDGAEPYQCKWAASRLRSMK
eukprot:5631678-Amphidinium_carterae.1